MSTEPPVYLGGQALPGSSLYPYLPKANVETPWTADYATLLEGGVA